MTDTVTVKQIILTTQVLKKNPFFIPIEKRANRYITGQDLTTDKMIGKTPLTPEEEKKYPYVIDHSRTFNFEKCPAFTVRDVFKTIVITS